jgi:hypothetical protein
VCEAQSGNQASWSGTVTVGGATPPPPPIEPACKPWAESPWWDRCRALKPEGTCEECAARNPVEGTLLARARAKVCEPICEGPVAPPQPPPTCEECSVLGFTDPRCGACDCPPELVDGSGHVHVVPGRFCRPVTPPEPPACPLSGFEVGCIGLGGSADLCRSLARYIGSCDPECDPKCYIPGVPSTALPEVVQVPGGGV